MAEEYQKNTENKEARDWFMGLCEYIEVYIFLGIYSYIYIYLRLNRCNYFLYFIIYIKKLLDEMKNKCPFLKKVIIISQSWYPELTQF